MELYAFSHAWGALAIELTLAVGFRCGGRNAMVANCQLLACADVCDATNESDEPLRAPYLKRLWVREDASLGERYPF